MMGAASLSFVKLPSHARICAAAASTSGVTASAAAGSRNARLSAACHGSLNTSYTSNAKAFASSFVTFASELSSSSVRIPRVFMSSHDTL